MALIIYALVGICFVAGIVLFIGNAPTKTKDRESFLQQLTKFVDGRLEQIEGTEKDMRVTFTAQNRELYFEDRFEVGFTGQVNKGFLKAKTDSKLILTFSEKKRKSTVKGDMFIASKVQTDKKESSQKVKLPSSLEMFEVHTNDMFAASQLLHDIKIGKYFADFRNTDQRGYPFMAIRVVDGVLIFEFQSLSRYKPSLMGLMDNIALMEDYTNKALQIAAKIDQIALSE